MSAKHRGGRQAAHKISALAEVRPAAAPTVTTPGQPFGTVAKAPLQESGALQLLASQAVIQTIGLEAAFFARVLARVDAEPFGNHPTGGQ